MAFTSWDQVAAALPKAQRSRFAKASATTAGAGYLHSMFGVGGTPVAGAKQGSLNGAIPDYTTTGAVRFRNPASGKQLYVGELKALGGAQAGLMMLVDRLWHNSEIACNITTDQTITQPALTRYTDGIGVEIWGEAWTAWGATATVFTVTYTNTDGVTGRTATFSWPAGAPTVGQAFRFVLQAGDLGVISIQKISLTPSTGGAGNLGLFLAVPIVSYELKVSAVAAYTPVALPYREVASSACLCGILDCSAATSGAFSTHLAMPEG